MPKISLSIVVTWANRSREMPILASISEMLEEGETEVVIVTLDGELESYIRSSVSSGISQAVRVICLRGVGFNKCKFINIGVYHSRATTVFLCDGDIQIPPKMVEQLQAEVTDETFAVVKYGVETNPMQHLQVLRDAAFLAETARTTVLEFSNGRKATYEFRRTASSRSASGLLLAKRENLLKVDGCNAELDRWGFEDVDLQIRLQAALGLLPRVLGWVWHVTHKTEDAAVSSASNQKNMERCFARYNANEFGGTYLEDVRWHLSEKRQHAQGNEIATAAGPAGTRGRIITCATADTTPQGGLARVTAPTRLSVIVPWAERSDDCVLLSHTFVSPGSEKIEVVLVTNRMYANRLSKQIRVSPWPRIKLVDAGDVSFNLARFINIGVLHATSASILLCDGDIVICDRLLGEVLPELKAGTFITIRDWEEARPDDHPHVLHELPCLSRMEEVTELHFADGASASVGVWRTQSGRSISRIMFVQRDDFLGIGGCNSRLEGQEIAGFDLQIRLQKVLGLVGTRRGSARHITHQVPDRDAVNATNFHDMRICTEEYAAGNFKGSFAKDCETVATCSTSDPEGC